MGPLFFMYLLDTGSGSSASYSIQEAVVPLMPGALNPLRTGIRSETAEAVQPGLNDL